MDTPTDPTELVKTAISLALALTDPAERARTITALYDTMADQELKRAREDDILTLRKTLVLREIGEVTGLSTGRIDQIIKARTSGNAGQ
jgi:DNA-directed RNA polymerase specialized sigma subunit